MNAAWSRNVVKLPAPPSPPESLFPLTETRTNQDVRVLTSRWLTALILLGFFDTWFLILLVNRSWVPLLGDILRWVANPEIHYTAIEIHGLVPAMVATIQIWFLGTLSAMVLLPSDSDKMLRRITALACGIGFTGLVVIILGIIQSLNWGVLNLSMFYAGWVFIVLKASGNRFKVRQILSDVGDAFSIWRPTLPRISRVDLLFSFLIAVIIGAEYYHAVTQPIVHWDALVYHATMAKTMFREQGIPIIAGTSVGIEMSANYPPLFPGLGAFYYVQIGSVDDLYLRLLSPTPSLLTIIVVYRIARALGNKTYGRLSALFVALTPLFILVSMAAINYLLLTFFVALTLLFIVLAVTQRQFSYWVAASVMFGFAFLTSYQAFFLLPAFGIAVLISLFYSQRIERPSLLRSITLGVILTLAIGGIWYARNTVVLGNPIYPFAQTVFSGKYIDASLLQLTTAGIHADSVYNFFGTNTPAPWDYLQRIFFNKFHFPDLSVFTLLGILMVLRQKKRELWLICLAFGLVPLIIVASGVANIFPRYFILSFPALALISAFPVSQAVDSSNSAPGLARIAKTNSIALSVSALMLLSFFFPTLLVLVAGQVSDADWQLPYDPLRLVRSANSDFWQTLGLYYGSEPKVWQWVNEHLTEGRKLATFENKIYYLKDGENKNFFYLDGWEAKDLYQIADPAEITRRLGQANVKYVLDPSWVHHWDMYQRLPLDRYLGTPEYFPLVYGIPGDVAVYQVGKLEDSLTDDSPLALSLFPPGLSAGQLVLGREARAIPADSNSIRLDVETSSTVLTTVEVDYLDFGNGTLSVNLKGPNTWIYDQATLEIQNSGQWKTFRFTIPNTSIEAYTELGLYAHSIDVLIGKIRAYPSSP